MRKIEHIIFWILILSIIGISVWLAFCSPSFETSLLTVAIFFAGSEILLWKFLFFYDKKTAVGFEKVRGDLKVMGNKFESIENRLGGIEGGIGEIRDKLIKRRN